MSKALSLHDNPSKRLRVARYTNDPNGNTLTGGGHSNTWDGENRLTQSVYGGVTTSHSYGADGLRRRTVQGTTTTDYVLDGDSAVRTLVNSVVDRTFLHGARGPEYERIGANAPVWNLYDGLGSVLGTVDAAGTIVSTRKYDVYGAVRSSTGPSGSKHKFCGGLGHPSEDETGLVYMRARFMDPVTGRFVSEDHAQHGSNWFEYAASDPVNKLDSDGRWWQLLAGALAGLTAGLANCMLQGWSWKNFAAGFVQGFAVGLAGALAGPWVAALVGAIIGAAVAVLKGGSPRDVLVGAFFGGVGGLAGGALQMTEGLMMLVAVSSVAIGLLVADAEAYATFFD